MNEQPPLRLARKLKSGLSTAAQGGQPAPGVARQLEQLGLVTVDLFDGKPTLTADGRAQYELMRQ